MGSAGSGRAPPHLAKQRLVAGIGSTPRASVCQTSARSRRAGRDARAGRPRGIVGCSGKPGPRYLEASKSGGRLAIARSLLVRDGATRSARPLLRPKPHFPLLCGPTRTIERTGRPGSARPARPGRSRSLPTRGRPGCRRAEDDRGHVNLEVIEPRVQLTFQPKTSGCAPVLAGRRQQRVHDRLSGSPA